MTLLFVAAFAVVVAALGVVFVFTDRHAEGSRTPSLWQYGSGAGHAPEELPPISQAATSVPTGSSDASHWPGARTTRNRPPHRR